VTAALRAPLLALAAAFCFSLAAIILKRGLAFISPLTAAVASVTVSSALVWIVVVATERLGQMLTLAIAPFLVAGFLAPGLSRLLLFVGYQRIGVSRTTPLLSTGPLFSISMAMLFLDERPSLVLLAGAGLIIAGGFLLSRRAPDDTSWRRRHLVFPLLAAAGFGLRDTISRAGLLAYPHPMLGAAAATLMSVVVIWLFAILQRGMTGMAFHGRGIALVAASGTCEGIAYLLMWRALAAGSVSVVSPLVQAGPVFTVLLALAFLRGVERVTWGIALASGLGVAGVALIVIGRG
jgi:drug/metabolite transporter, DME family